MDELTIDGIYLTLTTDAEIEYRSHYNGFQMQYPQRYMSAMAMAKNGDTYKVWWYFPNFKEVNALDELDYENIENIDIEKM